MTISKDSDDENDCGANSQSKRIRKDTEYLALPDEEIHELVFRITEQIGIEVFLKRMIILPDDFQTGQSGEIENIVEQSENESFARLLSAIRIAVKEDRLNVAKNTAFCSMNYAFQRSQVYAYALMKYLSYIRGNIDRQYSDDNPLADPSDAV